MDPIHIARELSREVDGLDFAPPVTHVYNPLDYARASVEAYLGRFARKGVEAVLVGMNPGPFGMAQTGVPFGEIALVRDWIGIEEEVGRPEQEHPKRPVLGFGCTRSEVSGRRLWGWARERFGSADAFFDRFFVWNYCPLAFLEESGRNRTPDKLPREERDALFAICDRALVSILGQLEPRHAIGVGKFAEARIRSAAPEAAYQVGTILHPSPASPAANRGWVEQAERQLTAMGIELE